MASSVFLIVMITLIVVAAGMPRVQRAEASGIIYIRANGSVHPSTAPVSTFDNITYTLNDNIGSVVVERDNIAIDGAGYAVRGKGIGSGPGVFLSERNNVKIINTKIEEFDVGLVLDYSWDNVITRNEITDNEYGVQFQYSSGNIISQNNIVDNDFGIGFGFLSNNNTVFGNTIAGNYDGFWLRYSSSNEIFANNMTGNEGYSIGLYYSSNNSIYHNNFVSNRQIYVEGSVNIWDHGYPSGGNYWSDYAGVDAKSGIHQNETGIDGIGDTAYEQDNYPLMGISSSFMVETPPFGSNKTYEIDVVSNSSVSDFGMYAWLTSPNKYIQAGQLYIGFTTSGENSTAGFCRMTIPNAVLNGTSYTVLVNLNPVNATILPGSNGTDTYLYFTYNHSAHEVIIIPEFPTYAILTLSIIATLLTVTVYKRKHQK